MTLKTISHDRIIWMTMIHQTTVSRISNIWIRASAIKFSPKRRTPAM
jgi:hypothetical protein